MSIALQRPGLGFVEGWAESKRRRRVRQWRRVNAATGERGGGGGDGGEREDSPAATPRLVLQDACRMRRSNTEGLLKERKLVLVLDLDNTLLHTIVARRMTLEEEYMAEQAAEKGDADERSMFVWDGKVTKLRPHARAFLGEASKMFDLYIYTMGVRPYALQMARFLDPHGLHFATADKVISREDCTVPGQKGLDVVPVDERIVLVLDDKPCVWASHPGSLIAVDRYRYFGPRHGVYDLCSRTTSDAPEIEPDRTLIVKLRLLQSLHRLFFSPCLSTPPPERDVRHFLPVFLAACNAKPVAAPCT